MSSRENRSRGGEELLLSILGGRSIQDIPAAEMAAIISKFSKYDPNLDPLTRRAAIESLGTPKKVSKE